MTLTGKQVREACTLLCWNRYDLQRKTALPFVVVDRSLSGEDVLDCTMAVRIILRDAFHRAGVDLTDGQAKLREGRASNAAGK